MSDNLAVAITLSVAMISAAVVLIKLRPMQWGCLPPRTEALLDNLSRELGLSREETLRESVAVVSFLVRSGVHEGEADVVVGGKSITFGWVREDR